MGAMPAATKTPIRADVTNHEVAQKIGVTHSMISRIRSGDRMPSLDLMLVIEREFKWPLQEQGHHRTNGTYVRQFEETIANVFHRPIVL